MALPTPRREKGPNQQELMLLTGINMREGVKQAYATLWINEEACGVARGYRHSTDSTLRILTVSRVKCLGGKTAQRRTVLKLGCTDTGYYGYYRAYTCSRFGAAKRKRHV